MPPIVGWVIQRACSLKQTAEEMNKRIKRTIGEGTGLNANKRCRWHPNYMRESQSAILAVCFVAMATARFDTFFFGAGCLVSKPSSTPLSPSLSLSLFFLFFSLSLLLFLSLPPSLSLSLSLSLSRSRPFSHFPSAILLRVCVCLCVCACVCVGGQSVCCSAQSPSLSGSSGSTHTLRFSRRPLIQVTPRSNFY